MLEIIGIALAGGAAVTAAQINWNEYMNSRSTKKIAWALNEAKVISKADTVWSLGCGMTAFELRAFTPYVRQVCGVDPNTFFKKNRKNMIQLKGRIEDKITELPDPDFVSAFNFPGIHRVVDQLLTLKSSPDILMELCYCLRCVHKYVADETDQFKSNTLSEKFGDTTYIKQEEFHPIEAAAYDMIELAKENGYKVSAKKTGIKPKPRVLFMSKNSDMVSNLESMDNAMAALA